MITGTLGAQLNPEAVPPDPVVQMLNGIVELVHGERPATAAQRARIFSARERVYNNIKARDAAGTHPLFTQADFNLLYHASL